MAAAVKAGPGPSASSKENPAAKDVSHDGGGAGGSSTPRKTTESSGPVLPPTPIRPFANFGPPKTDKELKARERILIDKYDVEAWNIIGGEAQMRPISEAAPLYEQFLTVFPTAARYWRSYVEAHLVANNDEATKNIFSRCLLNCLQVDLWRCYIRFIRKINDCRGADGREETKKAFDFMLGYIGMDIASGPVWLEYIAFLKAAPIVTPQEESQRMTAVRKAYQRAILAPIHLVEQLWKEYESFENSVSRALAKGLLAEYQPKHFNARAVYRERKKYWERIDTNMLAVPPTGSLKEEQQCAAWKQLLSFEKGNPQRLDAPSLTKRVAFTYEQCLMYLYHYPDIWYEYASWHALNGSQDSAAAVFQRALNALPETTILHYAYAEFEEARGGIQEAKRVYEGFVRNISTANALAYVQFMRFIHRTEGVDASRKVLMEARKSPNCTYHVYVASALMALCLDKDPKMARNIFEIGLKKFIHEPAYVLEYADFLCRLNDDQNVRVLFERALRMLPPDESVEVWNRFMSFEQTYGDLASMLKVEQRRKEAFKQDGDEGVSSSEGSLQELVSRYRFLDLWPCSPHELDHLARQQLLAQKLSGKTEKSGSSQAIAYNAGEMRTSGQDMSMTTGSTLNVIRPDLTSMVLYDPRIHLGGPISGTEVQSTPMPLQQIGMPFAPPLVGLHTMGLPPMPQGLLMPGISLPGRPIQPPNATQPSLSGHATLDTLRLKSVEEALKTLPPMLGAFLSQLPSVEGPVPDIEMVISLTLQARLPHLPVMVTAPDTGNLKANENQEAVEGVSGRGQSGANGSSTKSVTRNSGRMLPSRPERQTQTSKRKDTDRQEEEEEPAAQNRPIAKDVFRLRQLQRVRGGNTSTGGSTSGGSGAMTGELSGSSG